MMIYIAAPWVERVNMPTTARAFEARGHVITHRWWEAEDTPEDKRTEAILREQGVLDAEGVLNADALVLINSAKSEGKAVEQGLAIASGIPIIAVGTRGQFSKNVFHYMDCYTWVNTIDQALAALGAVHND